MPKLTALSQKGFTLTAKRQRGFTLIELLIVISIIGILAVAVLSAINPIEQIRKGTDTGKKSDSAELLNAMERFYATFQCYPWDFSTSCAATLTTLPTTQASTMKGGAAGTIAGSLNVLSTTTNELKSQFLTRTSLTSLYVTEDTGSTMHVCFLPDSKTFQTQAAAKTLQRDGTTIGCAGTTGATGCHVCVPE
ncbi:MAG: prepilin-type N-terminal cleavage/methylation domain-containing protein [Candidatus Blackburnbacteria bacterium]|nr:prepilin-type N-terminal cleavage/methylation domain-containing protein [Candidatus Blackburnbacteria bacterium]